MSLALCTRPGEQSHGEAFLALMTGRFGGQGRYILDEPEAALSPQRQLALLSRLHDLVLDGSQFIIATHSPILMAYPDARIYHCGSADVAAGRLVRVLEDWSPPSPGLCLYYSYPGQRLAPAGLRAFVGILKEMAPAFSKPAPG